MQIACEQLATSITIIFWECLDSGLNDNRKEYRCRLASYMVGFVLRVNNV